LEKSNQVVCDGRSHRSYFHLLSNMNFFDTSRAEYLRPACSVTPTLGCCSTYALSL
jgi:hypothetical protein